MRSKLEELFMAHQGYCMGVLTNLYIPYRQVMAGRIDCNQAVEVANSIPKDTSRHQETCEMGWNWIGYATVTGGGLRNSLPGAPPAQGKKVLDQW
jgi:hypothetical protein